VTRRQITVAEAWALITAATVAFWAVVAWALVSFWPG
jgi:hypothetical protein